MTKTRNLADLGGGFIQAGTGAVQRTVESKLQDMVSVLDFIPTSEHAAIKDGTTTTDVTTYINSALESIEDTGGTLLFPPGKYVGELWIERSNIRVVGYGASLGYKAAQVLTIRGASNNLSPYKGFDGPVGGPYTPNNVTDGTEFYEISAGTKGSMYFDLTATSGINIQAGDTLLLIAGDNPVSGDLATNHVPEFHQIVKVKSVSGSRVTLTETLESTISSTTDPLCFAIKARFTENIVVEGLEITNLDGVPYCCAIGVAYNVTLKNMTFVPETAWGSAATVRYLTYENCEIHDTYGFSNGRQSDNITVRNCTVTSDPAEQHYFYFAEEATKRLRVEGCTGVSSRFGVNSCSEFTDITVDNSTFYMAASGRSAVVLTNLQDAKIAFSNCYFSSDGGLTGALYPSEDEATILLSYWDNDSQISFSNCLIEQRDATKLRVGRNNYSLGPLYSYLGTELLVERSTISPIDGDDINLAPKTGGNLIVRNGPMLLQNITAPTSTPTGGSFLFVEGGALKFKGTAGTVTTIAPA